MSSTKAPPFKAPPVLPGCFPSDPHDFELPSTLLGDTVGAIQFTASQGFGSTPVSASTSFSGSLCGSNSSDPFVVTSGMGIKKGMLSRSNSSGSSFLYSLTLTEGNHRFGSSKMKQGKEALNSTESFSTLDSASVASKRNHSKLKKRPRLGSGSGTTSADSLVSGSSHEGSILSSSTALTSVISLSTGPLDETKHGPPIRQKLILLASTGNEESDESIFRQQNYTVLRRNMLHHPFSREDACYMQSYSAAAIAK